jgi:uncharacterized membrane protein
MTSPIEAQQLRYYRLDVLRGFALIAMALYHATWDLHDQGLLAVDPVNQPLFRLSAQIIAASFLTLSGISLTLTHGDQVHWPKFWKRERQLLLAAGLVSLGSYVLFPQSWIAFGILHHMALAGLLGVVLIQQPKFVIMGLALISFVLPSVATSAHLNGRWLEWIGLSEQVTPANDYVPLLPWFGFVLSGLLLGFALQAVPQARAIMAPKPQSRVGKGLVTLGQHGLMFYLIHQPVMIGAISAAIALGIVEPVRTTANQFIGACERDCAVENPDIKACKKMCGCLYEDLKDLPMMSARRGGEVSAADEQRIRAALTKCR